MTYVKQSLEWELAGEIEVLGENLPQSQFFHHKSHMTWPGLEPGPLWHGPSATGYFTGESFTFLQQPCLDKTTGLQN
jgi:hypothetical protein